MLYESHFRWQLQGDIQNNFFFFVRPSRRDLLQLIMSRLSWADIAIRYGLDVPGIGSRWERDFPHSS